MNFSVDSALALLLILIRTAVVGIATDSRTCTLSFEDCALLTSIKFDGFISFSHTQSAAKDFGGLEHQIPAAVLYPASVEDIAGLVKAVYASSSNLTIAAKGHGHSFYGQAQAKDGIVIEMSSLRGIRVFEGAFGHSPYVDARGGELWVDVVQSSLKLGLAPRSLTDYLYLTVGGTLSNAGISGQAFRYGPQISNVLQLEVVTGKGDIVVCSPMEHSDLFFGVLGGLGQFGIITRARIILQSAPQKVRWIRALYTDFATFTRDQENLISLPRKKAFDYVEGSVIINPNGSTGGWRSLSFHGQSLNASLIPDSEEPLFYCIELTKGFDDGNDIFEQEISSLVSGLNHLPSMIFVRDVPYFEFLNRVHDGEMRLRARGLWDTPHPWMNLFIPKSKVHDFQAGVFKSILKNGINGPLLIYPMNKLNWDPRMSAVTPDEDIFYLVGILRYTSLRNAGNLIAQNDEILKFCKDSGIGFKQYLARQSNQLEWRAHFGDSWKKFSTRKVRFDPKGMLAPGQRIFSRITHQQHPLNMHPIE